ncbi:uncharacterized protein LOC144573442 isoform X3 [Carex rostrata]
MDLTLTGEEIDQNLYLDLCPLLPDARWHSNSNLVTNPFSRTQPTFMEEDSSDPLTTTSIGPILPSTPNLNINRNPNSASQILNSIPSNSPSISTVGLIVGPDDSSPDLRNHHRDSTVWGPDDSSTGLRNHHRDSTVRGPDVRQTSLNDNSPGHTTMLIPLAHLVINGSQVGRVSSRDRLQENPQYRFQRLMEVNRNNMSTVLIHPHPDTSPERLRNNILALEASRRAKLKKGNGNGAEHKNDEGACQCGANFECNICFETSVEPVVTPCGHLFCWRCLYRWIRTQLLGICECPVCKGEVTESSLTPIFGRGGSSSAPDPDPGLAMEEIPPRPKGRRSDSTRQLMMRERDVRGRGFGNQEVERVRMDLEAVLARLRQMPRSNRGGTSDAVNHVDVFSGGLVMGIGSGSGLPGEEVMEGGGEGRGEGDGLESGAGSSVAGETHVRRRRRYR